MVLSDMISAINRRIDDVIPQTDAIEYLNTGVHAMEMEVGANFAPYLDGTDVTTFPFDEIWHTIPVLYAAAQYQFANLIMDSAKALQAEYEDRLKFFVEKYDVPPQYWAMPTVEQFTATAGQLAFVITNNNYDPKYNNLKVYVNNRQSFDWLPVSNPAMNPAAVVTTSITTNDPNGFIFNPTTVLKAGDLVTAKWVQDDSVDEPPYAWWGSW